MKIVCPRNREGSKAYLNFNMYFEEKFKVLLMYRFYSEIWIFDNLNFDPFIPISSRLKKPYFASLSGNIMSEKWF